MKNKHDVAFGIADGVGGWNDSGIDPSLFSLALMFHSSRYAKRAIAGEPSSSSASESDDTQDSTAWQLEPVQCLRLAFDAVLKDAIVEAGELPSSSTGLIGMLDSRTGVMKAANLGDSGFMVLRDSKPIHIQEPQTHYFNCPKQLSKYPPYMNTKGAIMDLPEHADSVSFSLRHGDVVLAYTDGVSDNVWPAELAAICKMMAQQGGPDDQIAQNMADAVVEYSMRCMKKTDKVSPFEVGARETPYPYFGGKVDDATAIAVLVSEAVHNPSTEVPMV